MTVGQSVGWRQYGVLIHRPRDRPMRILRSAAHRMTWVLSRTAIVGARCARPQLSRSFRTERSGVRNPVEGRPLHGDRRTSDGIPRLAALARDDGGAVGRLASVRVLIHRLVTDRDQDPSLRCASLRVAWVLSRTAIVGARCARPQLSRSFRTERSVVRNPVEGRPLHGDRRTSDGIPRLAALARDDGYEHSSKLKARRSKPGAPVDRASATLRR
jgi:hypothetical protein